MSIMTRMAYLMNSSTRLYGSELLDMGAKNNVRNAFSSKILLSRRKMGHKMKKIRERLDNIAVDRAQFRLIERKEDFL